MIIDFVKGKLDPKEGAHSFLEKQFKFRKAGIIEKNEIGMGYCTETIWWDRPLAKDTEESFKEENGRYAYNLPLWRSTEKNTEFDWKANYNFMLPKNAIVITVLLKYDSSISKETRDTIREFFTHVYKDSLMGLGVNGGKLEQTGSDFYYEDRKFGGIEQIENENGFSQCVCINTESVPESEDFAQLKGKYAHRVQITGIREEVPEVTRVKLLNEIYNRTKKFFDELED